MLNSLRLKSVLSVAVSFTCLFASAQNSFSKMNTPAVPTAESSHEGHGFSYVDYSSRMDKDINPESTEAFDMTPTPRFEENKGQWDPQVTYKTELTNGNIFFGKTGYTVQFTDQTDAYERNHHADEEEAKRNTVRNHAYQVQYIGANPNPGMFASGPAEYRKSYFVGNDSRKWAAEVGMYNTMEYTNVYPGINITYKSYSDNLKYDITVAPGADPSVIRMSYKGVSKQYVDANGNLITVTTLGQTKEYAPVAYQIINGSKVIVPARYAGSNGDIYYEFPNGYDSNYELVIDPFLVASTYSGSTADNWGFTACPGLNGNMCMAGIAFAAGYPTTVGAYNTAFSGACDITISIFNSTGTTLLASTYLGGTGNDYPHSIIVGTNGDMYLTGRTESNNFPTSAGCYDNTFNGGTTDMIICRLNSTLSTLIGSTYVGGSGLDATNTVNSFTGTTQTRFSYADNGRSQIRLDNTGNVVVVSNTQSANWPTTVGCYDNALSGTQDGVVLKMNNALTALTFSTYIGGGNYDACFSVQIDATNNLYVAGLTNSNNFPTTAGVINTAALGGVDGFVFRMNATGTTLVSSTYLGTANKDGAFNVDLDNSGNVYVFGLSAGGAYPVTAGVYSNANSCQFVHGLNAGLTATLFSTKYGNTTTPNISPTAFEVDTCGNIYCAGWGRAFDGGSSNGMPTTAGAYQTTTDGADFHFMVFDPLCAGMRYATFFGQNGGTADHVDGGTSLFSNRGSDQGVIYQAVCASCGAATTGFPTTVGAYSGTDNSTNCNEAVLKFDMETYSPGAAAIAVGGGGCAGQPITFTNNSTNSTTYEWDFGDGSPVDNNINPTHTYASAGTYTVQLVAFNATTCILSDTTTTVVTIQPAPTTANAGTDATACGLTATLAGNAAVVGTGTWTQVSGPGTTTFSNANSPTSTATASVLGAYVYQWTIASAPCNPSSDQVTITFVAAPTASNAGPDQTICSTGGSATMAGNNPAVGTGTWTQVSGPLTATITTPTNRLTTITGMTTPGVYVFQWSIANAPCPASTDQMQVTVNAPPTASNAGPDASVCGLTATLAGNVPTTGTGTWTQVAGPGTSTFSNANSATSNVTVSVVGVYTFRWTIANAPCTASQDNVIITFVAAPTVSNAGPDQTICTTGGSATMAGNAPVVGTGTWTQVSGPVTATITTPGSNATTITGMTTAGTYVFQWSIANAPCAASTDQITVTVNAPPTASNAGPDASVCGLTATLAGNVPTTGTGTWTQVAGPGTSTFSNANSATSNVTVSVVGAYTFRWTIANAPCTASQDNVIITFVAAPTVSNAGPDQTICSTGGSATMAGNNPAVGTGTWTQVSGPVTATITTPGSNATTITGMTTAGTYVFQWSIANAPCAASTDQITVTVNAPPTVSNAGPDASVCGLTATLAGNVPTTGTGTWTQVAGPGTATFSNANSATSNVTVSVVGVYTFRWTIANAPCTASQDNVIITFVAAPTVSNAGPDQTICSTGGSATMAGNVPTVGTGTWTQVSGPVTATITTPGSNATTITGMTTAGTYVFQWSIANSPCPSSTDQVQIIVNAPPTASNAGPDASVCGLTATLAANVPSIGTGTWTQTAGPGTSTFSNANSASSSVTVSTAGSYTFTWTIANAPCASSADAVTIVFTTAPTTANAGADQTICSTSGSATMAGNVPAVGTGTWSQVSGPVTATITTPGSNATTVTGMTTAGTYVFQWSIANAPCPASTDQVQIIVNAPPTASNAGSAASVCGLTATLAGNIPTVGTGTWTQTAGPGTSTFTNANLGSSDVTVTVAGTYTYTWTITNAPCAASASTVNITFVNAPSAALAGADDTICGLNSTLAGNIPASGTGTWTQVSGPGTTTFTNANLGNTAFSVSTQGVYVYAWTITNAPCPQTSDTVTITLDAQPSASNAGPDQLNVCPPSVTMAANAPVFGAGTWTQIAGPNTANIVTPNSEATSIGALIPGTYTFVWTITNGSCPATTDTVNVVVIGCDSDGDGINDITDLDDDNDGIPDTVETTADTDGDGIPNSLDLDSDNDGIPDVQEAGGNDTNNDGIIDGFTDLNGDGLDDNTAANPLPNPDTDGDGIVNAQDLDSDNDGITDVTEAGGTDANGDGILDGYVDTDGDGWNDVADANNGGTPLPTPDTDGDGHNDYVDLDSDNDGITDVTEAGGTDANGDGIIDGYTDTDGDGLSDNVDTNNGGTMLPNGDQDGDGIPNVLDLDSDNDGITDVTEAGGTDANGDGIIDGFADTDNDGLSDNVDPNNGGTPLPTPDTDGDGLDNYLDVDSDNDGITDVTEAGGTDANNDGIIDGFVDTDNDGLSDNVDTNNGGTMLAVGDFDNDGIENYLDLDSDNDGIVDVIEAGGVDGDNDGIIGTGPVVDTDGDGLSDVVDTDNGGTALPVPNTDASGGADYLDIDADNDGIVDNIEGQPTASYVAPTGVDTDGDGIDDAYDTIVGFGGAGVTPTNTDGADTPDYIDLDSDNDTAPDTTEGWDTNNDGVADTLPSGNDSDNDGLDDAYDADGTSTTNAGGSNNGGDLPTDFPDLDNVGGDRDWRDPLDTDGDGISNVNDLDDDNDGIPDTLEASGDTDGDGIPDSLDLDSDNDGIPDVIEAGGTDTNGDGIIDGFTDTDGDGLSDNVDPDNGGTPLPNPDTDGDGVNDAIDLDSDNDGITDVTEAGGTDTNGDGIIDGYVDTDGDGLSDNVDTNNGGTALPNPDTDGDGVNDVLDLDSDNDGITDVTEAGGTDANGDGIIDGYTDTDGDGLSDNVDPNNGGTPLPTPDTDGDGHNDYVDLDSDNDGITDVTEAGGTDANGDGIIDGYTDTDGDGLSDNVDTNNGGTMLPNGDQDGDGIPNVLDLDSDNDGITDVTEAGGTDANGDGIIDGYADTDNDGLSDNVDPNNGGTPLPTPDTDGDGLDNYLDVDSDNDGITDVTEAGGTDANNDGIIDGYVDTDNDGLSDNVDTNNGGTMLAVGDFDNDGIENYLDLDSDNDGIVDVIEAGGVDGDNDGIIGTGPVVDTDGDGLSDVVDTDNGGTALPVPNTDASGGADYLDIDADNDGIVDNIEGQPTASYVAPTGVDTDGDGIDDAYDTIVGFGGAGVTPTNTDGADTPDYIDLDTDNDGFSDLVEGWDTDNNNVPNTVPSGNDSDNDGLDDAFDVDGTSATNAGGSNNGGDLPTDFPDLDNVGADRDWRDPLDSDGDGITNNNDLDDDNDGIPDTFEASGDTDGDGIPDSLDLDSDNDGIPDVTEAGGTDLNGDGIIDGFTDTNGDGLDDNTAANPLPNGDTDGDGLPDAIDLDSDNDGIPDVTEAGGTDLNGDGIIDGYVDTDGDGLSDNVDTNNGGTALPNPDTDGDGVNDVLDLDSDNDGITDVTEAGGIDANGDGIIDGYVDTDNDGLSDNVDTNNGGTALPTPDTDGDGINDMLDLDSDNDGITDVVEAGGTDANGDGIIDGYVDTDGDGLSDNVDPNNGGTPLPIPDTDNDGHVNYLDIDADNDGIVDNIEAQTTAGYVPPTGQDTDGDGIDNAYDADNGGTPIVLTNTDGADNPDYLDLDSDNDGMSDLLEGWDTNNDGVADTTPSGNDSDNDGLDDAFDVDGTSTTNAGGATNGGDLPTDFPDLDNVGGDRDWRDGIDHDNDGIDDIVDLDDDNDGIPDTFEASGDTDGDGIPDSLDLDSDNDGIADIIEAGGTDANGDGLVDNFVDTNNDGLDDNIAANPIGNPDSDGDGIPNTTDLDSDNDGILDVIEAGGTDANGDGLLDGYVDTDGDGWNDNADPNAGGTLLPSPDTDSDGNMNFLDIDADNDGIVDNVEGQSTGGYTPPTGTDTDGDGIDDAYDIDNGGTPINPVNTDGTDNPDYLDLDSDNDGDSDAVEAWDTNNDGDPEITPTGNDSDGDGLDDAYDIDGTSTTNNGGATNGGTTPNSFPDLDNPGGDRDWREIIGTELEIPTGFSPNGDGVNDFFEIVGIGNYPDNKVTIFNRWGNLVYEAAGYDNGSVRWNGENTGNLSVGNGPVPEGTYFYVIDLGDGSEVISGYVFLNRQ